MWCSYARQNVTTLGNNTNKRLETTCKSIKEVVCLFMELDETIFALMYYQSTREHAYEDIITRLGSVTVHGYDKEMLQLANMVSQHACSLVESQYNYALATTTRYRFYSIQADMYLVCTREDEVEDARDEPGSEYAVDTSTWSCSCLFMMTRRLPCRHVLFLRRQWKCERKVETTIPFQDIYPRWVLSQQGQGHGPVLLQIHYLIMCIQWV
jgi:hypothetical protein